jgi:hypothetical protein
MPVKVLALSSKNTTVLHKFDVIGKIKSKIPPKIIKKVRVIEVGFSRIGMIGFGSSVISEITTHKPIVEQFYKEPENITTLALAILAVSVYPAIKEGYEYSDQREERIAGRFAMIAFTIMLLFECNRIYIF